VSPYLQAAPGSTHGYDVVDHKKVNVELGGLEAHHRFCERLREYNLGQILDIVPNHMSLVESNPYWWDVLENGPQSRFAQYFDIDWESGEARMRNKILLPILDDQYGVVLARGSIRIARKDTRFEVLCGTSRLPVAPHSMTTFLSSAAYTCPSDTLGFFADSFASLAPSPDNDPELAARQRRDRAVLFALFDRACAEEPKLLECMDSALAEVNADVDELDAFLGRQNYRIAHWRAADEDLGYRRFFDVNSLIGLRVERELVFNETHELILNWLRSGVLDGVRVDHPDGLRDPELYFKRLRHSAPDAWIVAEKILARNEPLRDSWPVDGTTGYDFLNLVNGLLVDPGGLAALDETYQSFIGERLDYTALVHDKKIAIMQEGLGSDVNRLSAIFVEICDRDRDHRDYSRAEIRRAIREMAAGFPVYRSYVSPDRSEIQEIDAAVIQSALDTAIQSRSDIDSGLFQFMADVLLMRTRGELESEFLLRFQQFTSPVMAKGFEDTVLYCYNRLTGLNEVGSDPCNAAVSIEEFHRHNLLAQKHHPNRMVTLTTHDTKRSEDVRARLAVLSESPSHFASRLAAWFSNNSVHRTGGMPDPNTEYLYYQTLIGAWPLSVDRAIAYMEKATREAKQKTSWTHPDEEFEQALQAFIRKTLTDERFVSDVQSFVDEIKTAGYLNSLTQTLLKYTVPGVPDLYQGTELWDLRLVDPDNRGPVDFTRRRQLLGEIKNASAKQVLQRMDEGLPKLWTIHHALRVRCSHRQSFGVEGEYTPLIAQGEKSSHVIAFLRGGHVAAVVPRLTRSLENCWGDTEIMLPEGPWKNVLSGETITGGRCMIADLLSPFPVALLMQEP